MHSRVAPGVDRLPYYASAKAEPGGIRDWGLNNERLAVWDWRDDGVFMCAWKVPCATTV